MYELEMNGQMIPFNFGMGFLREINKTVKAPVEGVSGVTQNIGLRYTVSRLIDKDAEALAEVLGIANKECQPRVAKEVIDSFIDDENTDIDEVFEKVMGFLKTTNATKNITMQIIENVEKEKAKLEAMDKMRMEAMA